MEKLLIISDSLLFDGEIFKRMQKGDITEDILQELRTFGYVVFEPKIIWNVTNGY